ncbi:MAG: hypothetical protein RRB13_13670 [bacterium]|nr:hypothetical protein [bacterium]
MRVLLLGLWLLGLGWAQATAQDLGFAEHLKAQGDCYRALSEALAVEYQSGESLQSLKIKLPCWAQSRRWDRFDPALDRALGRLEGSEQKQWALFGVEQAWDRGDDGRAAQLYQQYLAAEEPPYPHQPSQPKSVGLAVGLQAALPGAGLAYAGRWGPGLVSLGLNGLFIYGSVKAHQEGKPALAALLFFFEWGWYFGGIEAAQEAVARHNQTQLSQERRVWLDLYQQAF